MLRLIQTNPVTCSLAANVVNVVLAHNVYRAIKWIPPWTGWYCLSHTSIFSWMYRNVWGQSVLPALQCWVLLYDIVVLKGEISLITVWRLIQGEKLLGSLGGIFSKTWKPTKTRAITGPVSTRGYLLNFLYLSDVSHFVSLL